VARCKDDKPELVINAREPALGVGKLVRKDDERWTYRFTKGGERSFKVAYCKLYMKPAVNVPPEVRDLLVPPKPARKPLPRKRPPAPEATHAELEAQICQRPDDPEPYLVYGDWLQEQQDPRGQLIAIQAQLAESPTAELQAAEKMLLRKGGTYFVPEALARALKLPRSSGPRCEVAWGNGFFAHVRLARDITASAKSIDIDVVARAVLGHPSARFLRSLAIGPLGTRSYNYEPIVRAIASRPHPVLRELHVGDFAPTDSELAGTRAGDVSALFEAAPALDKLTLKAGQLAIVAPLEHARLRELSVTAAHLGADSLSAITTADLPALESLAVHTDATHARHFTRLEFPRLRRLVVPNTEQTAELVLALLGSPLLARLEELDLRDGDLDDRTASEMMLRREKLAHLRRLDVAGSPNLSPDWAKRLAAGTGAITERAHLAITEAEIQRRAPDAASLVAARKIAVAGDWLALGYDRRRDRVWGEYEGRDHYYVYAHLRDRAVGCGCGSPKNPCKHALALLLLAANRHEFREAPIPDAVARTASPWRPSYARDDW
jgi:uncharacterized protein (TIGR02996 family)